MLSPNTIYLPALKKYILDNLILLKETKHHSDSQIMSLTVSVWYVSTVYGGGGKEGGEGLCYSMPIKQILRHSS